MKFIYLLACLTNAQYCYTCLQDGCHIAGDCSIKCDLTCTIPQGGLSIQKVNAADKNIATASLAASTSSSGIECNGQCIDPSSPSNCGGGCTTSNC